MSKNLFEKFKKYHFEIRHLTVLFLILIVFQLLLSFIHKASLRNFVDNTQEWYQQHSAESLANLTTTTLELLLETVKMRDEIPVSEERKVIQFIDIIFSQQILQQNIEEMCVIVNHNNQIYAIDDSKELYSFLLKGERFENSNEKHKDAIELYGKLYDDMAKKEQVYSIIKDKRSYQILVPFVPNGEFIGAVYMRNTPDLSFVTHEIITNYGETSIIYSALIFLGFLSMYYISSYTVKERDDALKLVFEEKEKNLKELIEHEKEAVFTRRIYHTHHKAEKIMGFIKEDLKKINADTIDEITYRVKKYSNFISRVIYDMKWYDQPIQIIRSNVFSTNINEVIKFIVDNIILRTSAKISAFKVFTELDETAPNIPINEFVVWEALEPLIQNSIDHNKSRDLCVAIKTKYYPEEKFTLITISDNGTGINPALLEKNEKGIKKIFLENVSTKSNNSHNSGFGCYIAYEICKQRCGWEIDAENLPEGGSIFSIKIKV